MTKDDEKYNKKLAERYEEFYSSDSDEVIEIGLKFKINPRWYKQFIGFLQELESDSIVGHSGITGFFADGDGDFRFRWKFANNVEAETAKDLVENYFEEREKSWLAHPELARGRADSYEGIRPEEPLRVDLVFDAG